MSKYRVETAIPESQPEVDVKKILFTYLSFLFYLVFSVGIRI